MKYFSTFSGIGGFELGIQQSNAYQPECVGFSEIDKFAIQVYQKHFNHKNYGDITKIITGRLPRFDLLVGGFPCQTFSIAGKRKGFNETIGTLFFDLARILLDKGPRHFVFENVKGLLSHDNGETFKKILGILSNLGYYVEWQVLNAKNFGVPQNRERVFIVGHFGEIPKQKVFPIGQNDETFDSPNSPNRPKETPAQTKPASTISTKEGTRSDNNFIIINKKNKRKNRNCASCLTGGGHSGGNHSDMDLIQLNNPVHSNNRVYSKKGISPALRTMQGGNRQPFINSKTIIRRLTPLECERLMGFPDYWTAEGNVYLEKTIKISDTQRYKMCGNAVVVNCVKEIINKLYVNK